MTYEDYDLRFAFFYYRYILYVDKIKRRDGHVNGGLLKKNGA